MPAGQPGERPSRSPVSRTDRSGTYARLTASDDSRRMKEVRMTDTPDMEHSTAVLDTAHVGDIQGAFGTIRLHDNAARRTWGARLLTLLAIMGPGLIVMVGD